ncbi:serpin-ZXA-like [Iris pallida]|uniref:Serpin-ZXA-like n=1 Tax=Iris pallida TaxID=29817 RepID=A0AAX6EYX9_IRIPA|nr:serpin-ZXA-like [Iris pallida]
MKQEKKLTLGWIMQFPSESLDSSSVLVLCNALYFKGAWERKFDASMTEHSKFYQLNGSSVRVPFMKSREKQFISCYNGFSVLKLPYERGADRRQFSMYIILPDERDGLWNLSEILSSEPGFLDRYRPWEKVPVREFKIPRFKISFELEASEVSKGMGMVLPFSMEEADLSEMVDCSKVFREGYNLYVSKIFHKSVIEVTEEGTEAAAATAAVMCVFASAVSSSPPVNFVADHPFIFVIAEDLTGVVLFTGHVLNPSPTG